MKKIFAVLVIFVLAVGAVFTGCTSDVKVDDPEVTTEQYVTSENATETDGTTASTTTTSHQTELSVSDCLEKLASAETAEEVENYVTENTYDKADAIASAYPGISYDATTEKIGDYGIYEVHKYELFDETTSELVEKSMVLCLKTDDGYLICSNNDVLSEFSNSCCCSTCGGSGSIYTGTTCAICSGTGQQYIPNAYFDAALNMWQGQYQACSGCAGAGMTGGTNVICSGCGGSGFILD